MGSTAWYRQFARLDPAGGYTVRAIPKLKAFHQEVFPALPDRVQIQTEQDVRQPLLLRLKWYHALQKSEPQNAEKTNLWFWNLIYFLLHILIYGAIDRFIQCLLVRLLKEETGADQECKILAELCLRCYISNVIPLICAELETQFGRERGFTRNDLLPCVMDDVNLVGTILTETQPSDRKPFAAKVLETFVPERSQLSAWTAKLIRQHSGIRRVLMEYGVYLVTDWAILNDTTVEDVQTVFSVTFCLPAHEIDRACKLLRSYHAIYRAERPRGKGKCVPPTEDQLNRIRAKSGLPFSSEGVLQALQRVASYLRQYRISSQGGSPPVNSTDRPEINLKLEEQQIEDDLDQTADVHEFLGQFRPQLICCLDRAIEQEINDRLTRLHKRSPGKVEILISVLKLYYCDRKTMADIAAEVANLTDQSQVTRLLEIKQFRANIRHKALNCLCSNTEELAREFADPDCLENLDRKVEAALDEYLHQVIEEPSIRANASMDCTAQHLFVQRLCYVIETSF